MWKSSLGAATNGPKDQPWQYVHGCHNQHFVYDQLHCYCRAAALYLPQLFGHGRSESQLHTADPFTLPNNTGRKQPQTGHDTKILPSQLAGARLLALSSGPLVLVLRSFGQLSGPMIRWERSRSLQPIANPC